MNHSLNFPVGTTTYAFVVKTDAYAGNFERELTAAMTGCIGECEVGSTEASNFIAEVGEGIQRSFEYDKIRLITDDEGCSRPASIWNCRDEDGFNSAATFFRDRPTEWEIELMKERAYEFASRGGRWYKPFKIKGFSIETISVMSIDRKEIPL